MEDTLLLCEDARQPVSVLSTTVQMPWARRTERDKRLVPGRADIRDLGTDEHFARYRADPFTPVIERDPLAMVFEDGSGAVVLRAPIDEGVKRETVQAQSGGAERRRTAATFTWSDEQHFYGLGEGGHGFERLDRGLHEAGQRHAAGHRRCAARPCARSW